MHRAPLWQECDKYEPDSTGAKPHRSAVLDQLGETPQHYSPTVPAHPEQQASAIRSAWDSPPHLLARTQWQEQRRLQPEAYRSGSVTQTSHPLHLEQLSRVAQAQESAAFLVMQNIPASYPGERGHFH